jgi:hypothetical protein
LRTSRHVRLLSGRKLLPVAIVGNAKITDVLTNPPAVVTSPSGGVNLTFRFSMISFAVFALHGRILM